MSSASERDPIANTNTQACSISSKMTFVINTHGPGPFTFNINLNGTSPAETVNFTVNNTPDTAETRAIHLYPRAPTRPPSGRSRKPLSRANLKPIITARKPFRTPRKSGTDSDNDRVVLETPNGMLAADMPPRKKLRLTESQEVNVSDSPQSDFDASETEGSVSEYHANEPVAVFSPSCQLVSPSRKRIPDRTCTHVARREREGEEKE
ncbi:hypothetical protein B0H14DRAFT_3706921 [Mycena olivaceomarginata]|nr:hypothetical protein B0H14DRAFT_3706921 [Mycena olivaceomarginata]